ncbi:MAG TPA: HAD-IIB family hydrolase [Pirellulales bacterium]|jgi:sucrose-6F-phosphate phosphohydrolase|nr:HAD-IIB family hydrolase [Pirellulales bacterium]
MEVASLLVSDLDFTLLGDDRALEEFANWYETRRLVLRLVYASGRFYESIVESIRSTALPEPVAVIADVGTDIRWYESGASVTGWREQWTSCWDARRVRAELTRFSLLRLQAEAFQSDYKVSYFATNATDVLLRDVGRALQEASLSANLIYSSNRDLDVVPTGANKGTAAAFLARHWGLAEECVLVRGDSGNDMAMFSRSFRGIVIANAHPDLKALAGQNVFLSQFAYAHGVLDGVRHWLGN